MTASNPAIAKFAETTEGNVLEDGFDVLRLDPSYDGSCPCARITVDGQKLRLHCWRVCFDCEYVGIHYEGIAGRLAAEKVKPLLDEMNWYGEWATFEDPS